MALQSSEDVADLEAARAAFERAVELKPDYHTAILNLASFHAKQVRLHVHVLVCVRTCSGACLCSCLPALPQLVRAP